MEKHTTRNECAPHGWNRAKREQATDLSSKSYHVEPADRHAERRARRLDLLSLVLVGVSIGCFVAAIVLREVAR